MSDGSDHWDIINSWRAGEGYIEKKKKEAEAAVPTIGLPHATNVAEVHQNGTTEGSNSAVEAGTQNLPLSTDKDTKKINDTNEAWEATSNPTSAADEVTQHDAYRDALTAQYGAATRDTEADKVRKQQVAKNAQYRKGKQITLTDVKGNSLTVRLSDEKDRNGKPYVLTSDGKLSYGVIPGGLVPEEPKTKEVRLSLGNQDDPSINHRYGLVHIMEGHFAQLKDLGFDTVEAYIKHVLGNIGGAVLDKIYEGKTTHFVFTTPFVSENHPKQKRVDTIIVELHEESDHWDIINTWRSTEAYIKKKIEKRGTVPSIGLSHAADKTEVFDESTTRSSGSQREGNSPRFSSTDKATKKINDTNEAWEATSNPQSAEDEVTQHDAYRRALTAQYGETTRDTEANTARK